MPVPAPAVQPILLTFGTASLDMPAKLLALNAAHQVVREWYADKLGGETFPLLPAIAMPGGNRADYGDGTAWGAAHNASGYTWAYDQFFSLFVDTLPYTTLGLGGASTGTNQASGVVVKDGDCVNVWRGGTSHVLWNNNIGMLAHELAHMFGLGHENPDGNNIEWEWALWPNCIFAAENIPKLIAHRLTSQFLAAAPSGPTYAEGMAAQKAIDVAKAEAFLVQIKA